MMKHPVRNDLSLLPSSKRPFSDIVYAWVTPFTDIYSEKEMTGGSSSEEFFRINQFYMETSQNTAKYQGLKTAGKETEMEFLGVYVMQVAEDSTFKGVLNIADTVTAVNDKTFKELKRAHRVCWFPKNWGQGLSDLHRRWPDQDR